MMLSWLRSLIGRNPDEKRVEQMVESAVRRFFDEQHIFAERSRITEVESQLRFLQMKWDDAYNQAYARVAERQLESMQKHLAHEEYVQTELLKRWNAQVDDLKAQIAELKSPEFESNGPCEQT